MKITVRVTAALLMTVLLVFNSCSDDDSSRVPPVITSFSPTEGTAGTTVTINGTNFSTVFSENIVKFNGTAANVTAATATSLTVAAPAGGLTGKITVQVGTQTAASLNDFVYVPVGVVSTLAGSGTKGFADGAGTAAQFSYPTGVAVDASGNVYLADQENHRIRKITAGGVVSTLAGSGIDGFADGTGIAAQFRYPTGVAVDASGNVYVADNNNNRIRKITAGGVVSTLAGSGIYGFADGTGTAAQFSSPSGVAVDASGNVYVADQDNHRIRKITAEGVVSTVAGSGSAGFADGTSAAAQFQYPYGVAVDATGSIYVADLYNHRIRKITAGGVVSTLAGSGIDGFADGTGAAAQFRYPAGVAVDVAGNVYVVDQINNRIRKITAEGVVSTLAGSGTKGFADGTGTAAQFSSPYGVAVDATGSIYVADTNNHCIRKIQ